MGMSVGARKAVGRRGRRGRSQPMAEINVTPLVDVMLVLLIVFMVAAPLLTVGVAIDLPQTQAKSLNTDQKPITVSVKPDGTVFLMEDQVQLEELTTRIAALTNEDTDQRIYVRGDNSAGYGTVMQVMGVLSGAGYGQIGLITEKQDQ